MIEAYYVYGVLPAGAPVPSPTHSLGGTVRTVEAGPIAALVEEITDDRELGLREDLVAHSEVLNQAAEQTALVPLRFGSVLPSVEVVEQELLTARRDELLAVLEELSGRAQFTLRARYELDELLREIVLADPEIGALRERVSGLPEDAAYFDRVRLGELVAEAVAGHREREAAELVDAVGRFADDHVVREPSGMDHLLDAAFLVRHEVRAEFEAAAEHQAESLAGRARLRLLGPTAAFDFVPHRVGGA